VFRQIFTLNYHPELIRIFIGTMGTSTILANLIGPLILAVIFFDFLSPALLAGWAVAHLSVLAVRFRLRQRMRALPGTDQKALNRYLAYYIVPVSLTGMLWGSAAAAGIYFLPDAYIYFITSILIGTTAGALVTLGTVYHIFAAFAVFMTLPAIAMLAVGKSGPVLTASLVLAFFLLMILKLTYRYYLLLKKSVLLNEEVRELNATLEERIRKEVRKNRLQQQMMLQQMRLAQMGEMISMIAHQWRQPLNAIGITAANLELNVLRRRSNDADVVKGAQDIATYVRHLSGTIEDFRNFFQPDKKCDETTYDALIDSVMAIIKPSILSKRIDVTLALKCHEPFTTYVNEVRQVILNLITNAEDILAERAVEHPGITITTFRDGEDYALSIGDNGGGVPEAIIERIFDPYFSTKSRKNGTGLGLYMSKTIVEEHCGGALTVENAAGGAVFTMRLRDFASEEKPKKPPKAAADGREPQTADTHKALR